MNGTNLNSTKIAIKSISEKIILILGGFTNDLINPEVVTDIINNDKIKIIICYGQIGRKIFDIG